MSPSNPVAALLQTTPVIVLDGALATELEARGCDLRDPLWSARVLLEAPELIYRLHLDYFNAGAQCAITASYQATPQGFRARGLGEARALDAIANSVELAARAREDYLAAHAEAGPLLVAGSVGPYGACLANGAEYRGDYALTQGAMMAFHRPRIAALVDAGVDVLACETQPSLPEIVALAALLREFPRISAWFSCTLRDAAHLADGTPLCEVMAVLGVHPQVAAVGVNCIALEDVTAALTHLASLTSLPLVAYPNSGERYDAVTKTWRGGVEHGCMLADRVAQWRAAGARLVGGCCRTSPRDIAAVAAACRNLGDKGERIMDESDICRQRYAQLGLIGPATLLHIGARQTQVMTDGASVLPLELGSDKTVTQFFHHLPPTPGEMELAIMTVEDEVTRIHRQVDNQSALYLLGENLAPIAQATGVEADAHGWLLTQDDIERLFKRYEQVMLGRPAAQEGVPLENAFAARLLIVREFMHHLGFPAVRLPDAS